MLTKSRESWREGKRRHSRVFRLRASTLSPPLGVIPPATTISSP